MKVPPGANGDEVDEDLEDHWNTKDDKVQRAVRDPFVLSMRVAKGGIRQRELPAVSGDLVEGEERGG